MVKRYWVNNSDDEEYFTPSTGIESDQQMVLTSDGPITKDQAATFVDEFFPVTVCKKKQFLRVPDPLSTFMYDRLEPDPEFVILNNRSNVEIMYQSEKPEGIQKVDYVSLPKKSVFRDKPFVKTAVRPSLFD